MPAGAGAWNPAARQPRTRFPPIRAAFMTLSPPIPTPNNATGIHSVATRPNRARTAPRKRPQQAEPASRIMLARAPGRALIFLLVSAAAAAAAAASAAARTAAGAKASLRLGVPCTGDRKGAGIPTQPRTLCFRLQTWARA